MCEDFAAKFNANVLQPVGNQTYLITVPPTIAHATVLITPNLGNFFKIIAIYSYCCLYIILFIYAIYCYYFFRKT